VGARGKQGPQSCPQPLLGQQREGPSPLSPPCHAHGSSLELLMFTLFFPEFKRSWASPAPSCLNPSHRSQLAS
jgi:hypothetical protein